MVETNFVLAVSLIALAMSLLSKSRTIYDESAPDLRNYFHRRVYGGAKHIVGRMVLSAAALWCFALYLLGIGIVGILATSTAYLLVGMLWGLAWLPVHYGAKSFWKLGRVDVMSEDVRRMVVSRAINWPVNMTVEVVGRALVALWSMSTRAYFGTMNLLARLFLRGRR